MFSKVSRILHYSLSFSTHPRSLTSNVLTLNLSHPTAARILSRTMASSAAARRLQDKTVLITGASSGIGKSTALEFARTAPNNGLRIIVTARRLESLQQLATDIDKETSGGVKVLPVKLDVSDPQQVRGLVAGLPEEWRGIDVLVNNA